MKLQSSLFDEDYPDYSVNKKIRLIELFAGYGSQSLAMKRLGVDFESYKAVEFDEHACHLYNVVHGTNFPILDITKISAADLEIKERDKYEYILFYSFPCTDLSVAGQQKGMSRDSKTRSGLLWEVERLMKELDADNHNLPQILIMENVSQVHSEKNMPDFQEWINFLNTLGYSSFYQDLNSKDFGVPQNRERTFMVSILGTWNFDFPEPMKLKYCMADVLEKEVEEKFFLNSERADNLIKQLLVEKKIPELPDEEK